MKRETFRHPKMYELCSRLNCTRPTALGYLALLWDFTAEHAPDGAIGRWPDGSIERSVDWTGEPSVLMAALVDSGWVDADTTHRYIIHDWADHCERWVKAKLERLGKKTIERSTVATVVATTEPTPPRDQTKPNQTKPNQTNIGRSPVFVFPLLSEVLAYCKERKNSVDADSFVDFYTSKGWMVGKNKMKDWKACVRTWEKHLTENSNGKASESEDKSITEFKRQWDRARG